MAAAIKAGGGLLGTPSAYGVEVEEIVEFDVETKPQETTTAESGPGLILVAKACDALGNMGYEEAAVRKVGLLATQNLMTASSTQLPSETQSETSETNDAGADDVIDRVGLLLQGLLDEDVQRSHTVHINSNEAVVLINVSGQLELSRSGRLVDETVLQLQQKWNIWPVRVYGGPFVKTAEDGFSITLLNVVNTDIGGPSMVQLLDADCESPEWCSFTRREAWRERDLLYREERGAAWGDEEIVRDDISARSLNSDGDASLDSLPVATEESYSLAPPSSEHENQPVVDDAEAPRVQDDNPEVETVPQPTRDSVLAGPKEEEIAVPYQYEQPETHVEHPTWSRDDDSFSLLDLIKAQASTLLPSDKHATAPDERQQTSGDNASQAQDKPATEDEFVVL